MNWLVSWQAMSTTLQYVVSAVGIWRGMRVNTWQLLKVKFLSHYAIECVVSHCGDCMQQQLLAHVQLHLSLESCLGLQLMFWSTTALATTNHRPPSLSHPPTNSSKQVQFMKRCLQRSLNWERMWPTAQCRGLNWQQIKPMGLCSTELLLLHVTVRHLVSSITWSLWSFQDMKASV